MYRDALWPHRISEALRLKLNSYCSPLEQRRERYSIIYIHGKCWKVRFQTCDGHVALRAAKTASQTLKTGWPLVRLPENKNSKSSTCVKCE